MRKVEVWILEKKKNRQLNQKIEGSSGIYTLESESRSQK